MDNAAWKRIQKLRQSYLVAQGFLPDYWVDDDLLSAYDETLAQRIRWKWRAVIDALPRDCSELPETIVDWGCGTGAASRELLSGDEQKHFKNAVLMDRSGRAVKYAGRKIKEENGHINILAREPAEPFILLVSHVFSELPEEELNNLLTLVRRADYLLWVESGRLLESRRISALREDLRATHNFLAPCPHQGLCGMLRDGQEANWCHFKAPVPREAHQSAFWRECSKQLGFDLRSLPVAYLFAQKKAEPLADSDGVRILAGSRPFKGYVRYFGCHATAVFEAEFMKRNSRKIYEDLAEPGLGLEFPREDLIAKEKPDGSL